MHASIAPVHGRRANAKQQQRQVLRGKTWDDVMKKLEKEWDEKGLRLSKSKQRDLAKDMVMQVASSIAQDILKMVPSVQQEVMRHVEEYKLGKSLEAQDAGYVSLMRGNHVSKFVVDFAHQLTENVARVYLCRHASHVVCA